MVVDDAAIRHAVEIGERRVVHDVVVQHEAELLAVFGDIGKAGIDRLAERC